MLLEHVEGVLDQFDDIFHGLDAVEVYTTYVEDTLTSLQELTVKPDSCILT